MVAFVAALGSLGENRSRLIRYLKLPCAEDGSCKSCFVTLYICQNTKYLCLNYIQIILNLAQAPCNEVMRKSTAFRDLARSHETMGQTWFRKEVFKVILAVEYDPLVIQAHSYSSKPNLLSA